MIYQTKNVCAKTIEFEIEDGKLKSLSFDGGCPGNLIAISKLGKGMKTEEIIEKLSGIKCGNKDTSCADQLAKALKETL